MERYFVILEVSQKQSFIFGHKKLQNNVIASDVIRFVTSPVFFCEVASDLFDETENLVYDGGGHTILEFPTEEAAKAFVSRVTAYVLREFPMLELFAKVEPYDEKISPAENENRLIGKLEEKKSMRRSVFHQGSFGVEASAVNRLEKERVEEDLRERVKKVALPPFVDTEKYQIAYEFEHLGGKKDESNFIAVVHIDGNLMGRRVSELNRKGSSCTWEDYKKTKREFSEQIDQDFKEAFREMIDQVDREMKKDLPEKLNLGDGKKPYFPVRRIILAGDDVCFVTEGRIGLECARIFLESLYKKKNETDEKNYSACAGVAIVHLKYPFYRAYELAEALCSNAKKYIANLAKDEKGDARGIADVCALDWHIEFGEMANGLSAIRRQYRNVDGYHLEARPYIVCGDENLVQKDEKRGYDSFRKRCMKLANQVQSSDRADSADYTDSIARSKLKQLRSVLKQTEESAKLYVKFQRIWNYMSDNDQKELFYKLSDGQKHALIFDALELMDTFVPLGGEQ